MIDLYEILKVIILGIIEGITEWLPISSTGHMLLVDEFIKLNMSSEFKEMFFVVIQLGAILAVVVIFWKKMFPFQFKEKQEPIIKINIISLWLKVVVACIPGAVITILFDDYVEANFKSPLVIALALIVYGILFIVIERRNKNKVSRVNTMSELTYKDALVIGAFQVLSIIPGTSRSGSTIIGGLLIGISRMVIAEFTFFLAVPVMFGLSAIKLLKFGFIFTQSQLIVLLVGTITAFIISILVIKFFINYIKKHDFQVFGWYRIVIGIVVFLYFYLQ